MKFKTGLPPTNTNDQYILKMKNHPDAVGMYNTEEKCFVIADCQCSEHKGEPWDCWYESSWIDNCDIVGFWEMPDE